MNFLSRWLGSVGRRFRASEDPEETANESETGNDTEAATRDEPRSSLFYCPDCKAVYIATDKTSCSTCDTAVDQVSSTLTRTV